MFLNDVKKFFGIGLFGSAEGIGRPKAHRGVFVERRIGIFLLREESGRCRVPGFSRRYDSVLHQSCKIGVTLICIKRPSPIEDKVGANESDRFKSGSTAKVKRFSWRAYDTVAYRDRKSVV